jgi:hypothetical protein
VVPVVERNELLNFQILYGHSKLLDFVFPSSESVTILCTGRAPVDVAVTRIGKLGISANCKGCSKSALFHLDTPGFDSDLMSSHYSYLSSVKN